MSRLLRLAAWREHVSESLWWWPTVGLATGFLLGVVLGRVGSAPVLEALAISGDPGAARDLLIALLGAFVTVTGVLVSMTLVAFQIALQQFSPRLLDSVLRDRKLQVPLALLLGTVAYLVAVLQAFPSDSAGDAAQAAVAFALVDSLAMLGVVVYFINHVARGIRVESLMDLVSRRTREAMHRVHGRGEPDTRIPAPPPEAAVLTSRFSGYVQNVDLGCLVEEAVRAGAVVQLLRGPGSFATAGAPLARWWPADGAATSGEPDPHDCLRFGFERTMQATVVSGFGQLADMAVKALSPAVNDPRTAIEATHHLGGLLVVAARCRPAWLVGRDGDGAIRAIVPRPDFSELLALSTEQVRRYGAAEPSVVAAQLAMLVAVAHSADAAQLRCLAAEVDLVTESAIAAVVTDHDRAFVTAEGARARERVAGLAAAGVTRASSQLDATRNRSER